MYFVFSFLHPMNLFKYIHWPETFNGTEIAGEHLNILSNILSSSIKFKFLFGYLSVQLNFILLLSCWNWIGTVVVIWLISIWKSIINKKILSIFFLCALKDIEEIIRIVFFNFLIMFSSLSFFSGWFSVDSHCWLFLLTFCIVSCSKYCSREMKKKKNVGE